eukprot:811950-Alexandrium_andersonii.AAC.1
MWSRTRDRGPASPLQRAPRPQRLLAAAPRPWPTACPKGSRALKADSTRTSRTKAPSPNRTTAKPRGT